jgi:hypothetical protein
MQSFVAGVVNEIRTTRRKELAGGSGSFRPERNQSCFGRSRILRDGLLVLLPTFHRHHREQNQNRGSSEAKS